jgi:hypothetical protein
VSADFQIEAHAGGRYDLTLNETDHGLDAVLIGDTEATHPAAVLQRITYATGVWLGESRFDRSIGFPWEQAVFGRQPLAGIPLLLADAIQAVDGVEGLIGSPELLFDSEARRLVIQGVQVQGEGFALDYESEVQS